MKIENKAVIKSILLTPVSSVLFAILNLFKLNIIKKYDLNIVSKVLERYNLDLNVRAEQLEYNIFVELANNLYK